MLTVDQIRSKAKTMRSMGAATIEAYQLDEMADEIERLRKENAEAVAGLMCVASLTQTEGLLWWQKKARETLSLMGINKQ